MSKVTAFAIVLLSIASLGHNLKTYLQDKEIEQLKKRIEKLEQNDEEIDFKGEDPGHD